MRHLNRSYNEQEKYSLCIDLFMLLVGSFVRFVGKFRREHTKTNVQAVEKREIYSLSLSPSFFFFLSKLVYVFGVWVVWNFKYFLIIFYFLFCFCCCCWFYYEIKQKNLLLLFNKCEVKKKIKIKFFFFKIFDKKKKN